MKDMFQLQTEKYTRENKKKRKWQKVLTGLAAVAVFCTTYALILPAITWEKSLICDLPEHHHDESCYEVVVEPAGKELVCQTAGHEHGAECYEERLVCGMEESEEHVHSDACYSSELVCTAGEHTHTDACYQTVGEAHEIKVLTCRIAEHEHTAACFDAPPAEAREYHCGQSEHVHGDRCYYREGTLKCTIPEHTHSDSCRTGLPAVEDTPQQEERTAEEIGTAVTAAEELQVEEVVAEEVPLEEVPVEEFEMDEFPGEKAAEEETEKEERTIVSEPASDGAVAVITGCLPAEATARIEKVNLSENQLIEYFGTEKTKAMNAYTTYDITILVDGEEWQPDDTVSVLIRHPDIHLSDNQTLEVAHVDSATNEVSVVSSELNENGDISISAEGFSLYIAYTVDFHYGELIYRLSGGDSVLLSELFIQLGMEESVTAVTEVRFSNPDLVAIEPTESDWLLISLMSFETEETLDITFSNGNKISIKVTDPQESPSYEPGLIKIKLNLFDWDTGDPLPFVTMGINRQSILPLGTARGIIKLTSDKDGVAYTEVPYKTIGTKTYINNGTVEIFDSTRWQATYTRFDMDSITGNYEYDISVSGRIRNSIWALHAGAVPMTAGSSAYDDFYFHSGMPASGAYVEFNVYLKDKNSGTHTISFDTSTISNASDFTSISISHGQSVNTAGITIPAAINKDLSTLPLLGWTCSGVDFDLASPVNHDIVLKPKWASMCTVSFDTSKVSNPDDYPDQQIMGSQYATEPSEVPVNISDPGRKFLHWSLNGEPFDFANTPITENIILKPVWEAEGIIHFKVYMWDHEYYVNHGIPGAGDHRADGQTKIPIDGVKMVVKTYPGSDGGSEGTPAAADWDQSWNGMIEDYRKSPVGRPGGPGTELEGVTITYDYATGQFQGDYVITADQLQYLKPGYIIDTDPDIGVMGRYNRGEVDPNYITGPGIGYHAYEGPGGFGDENTVFDWDWYVAGEDTAGAGNTGVRVIPECKRRGGTVTNGTNLNDVAQISQEMIDDGFEFTFVCFVVPAVVVRFDSAGGSPSYPMQKFKPVNSIPAEEQKFKATKPTVSPSRDDQTEFAGWYEVIGHDEYGMDILDNTPWDFNRVVTHSMTLKAVYADKLYRVLWKDELGHQAYETDQYRYGDIPYYDGEIPVKASDDQYDYEFKGWELVDPQGDPAIHPGRTGTTVESNQEYNARFTPIPKKYTVKWVDWNWDPDDETGLIEKDENVSYGSIAHFDGTEPTRADTPECTYTFTGWKMIEPEEGTPFTGRDGEEVHSNQIYQAQYSAVYTHRTLKVIKEVIGTTTLEEFSFELEVTNSDDTIPDFSGSELPSGVTLKPGTTNILCFSLGNNEFVQIESVLPANSKLTLSETAHAGYNVTMDTDDAHYSSDCIHFVLSKDMNVTVKNSCGTRLPETGGMGVYPIYLLGWLLILGSIGYGYMLRRKCERRDE